MSTDIQTRMTLIVGTNGTGKSTVARKILTSLTLPRSLVVTRHLTEWNDYPFNELQTAVDLRFRGINYHVPKNAAETLKRLQYFRNGAILFDDARKYLKAKTEEELNDMYISRRQNGIHIFFVAHNFKQIPVQAFGFATDFILFKTNAAIDNDRLSQLNEPDKFLEIKKRVDQKAKANHFYYEMITI